MAAPEVAGDPGAGWDEAQCTAALAQLEQLQAQVSLTVPPNCASELKQNIDQ